MNFANGQMLWLLVILVLPLIGFFWWAWRRRQELITQFISARLLGHLKVGVSPSRQKARMALLVVAVIFIICALARPQWGVIREELRQRGLDIVVAIDTSNSMLAEDVSPNRLTRAKLATLDLMRRAKTDRLGLIAFAGSAFLECPLTLDDGAFSQSVNALDTKTISQGGTAIGEAIDEARKTFKEESDNHKVLVLFTDGEDQDSDAVAAAQRAAKDGISIFTIGIGSTEGELLPIRDERGRVDYIRDEDGKPVKSHLNEELLQEIARDAKGFYLHLLGTKTMDTLYDRGIAPLPKTEFSSRLFQHRHEQFQWFLAVAIVLLIIEIFLPDRKPRRAKGAPANSLAAAMTETVAVLLILALPVAAFGSPASALREYQAGQYDQALKDYNKALEHKKDDPRLHFNAGAAAYQSHQLDQAAKEFSGALESPDLQLQQRAYYNLGNTLYRAGQQIPEAGKKEEAWKKALENYESALKLNKLDPDAKYNQEFVTKQLEELKKQQQQQQQNQDKNQKQNKKDQKDQKDQKNQDNQGQKGQDKDQSKQDQNSKANNSDQKSEQQKEEEKKKQEEEQAKQKQQEQQQNQDKDKDKEQQARAKQDKEKDAEEAKREAAMMAAGQMTPQQAKQLLDAQKDDEHVFQFSPTNKNNLQSRSYKNW